jgi:hypothetical protein
VKIPARILLEAGFAAPRLFFASFAIFGGLELLTAKIAKKSPSGKMPVRAGGPVTACAGAPGNVSSACQKFLEANERARVQWKLEREFTEFEHKF